MKIVFLVSITVYYKLFAAILAAPEPFVTEIDGVLDHCCDLGEKQADPFKTCAGKNFNISDEIPYKFHGLCRANIAFCCEKTRQSMNCQAGKNYGRTKVNCNDRKQSEMFQLCCNACKVGQQLASTSGQCDSLTWDALVDRVKNDCCQEFKDNENHIHENSEDDYDDEDDVYLYGTADDVSSDVCDNNNTCEQQCYVRGNNAFCDCFEGYQLGTDRKSCYAISDELRQVVVCEKGLKDNGFGDCEDIDECKSDENVCRKYEECINTVGSFVCQMINFCPEGFAFSEDMKKCEDINECSQSFRCSRLENCENTNGSFICRKKICGPGYKLDEKTGDCNDVDECFDYNCGRNRKCVNLPGSFRCECDYGFKKDPNSSRTCRDIDECLEHPEVCEQHCRNTYGGYQCGCKRGFVLNHENNRTCNDIDECERFGKTLCPVSHCQNTNGGYKCYCPEGYRLLHEGLCVDINECNESKNLCQGKNQHCLNMQGTYRCIDQSCDVGYRFKNGTCHLMDSSLCFENSNEIGGQCKIPLYYGFIFGTFVLSNATYHSGLRPHQLVIVFPNISGGFTTELKDFQSLPMSQNVKPADKSYFSIEKQRGKMIYKLMKPIEGPQDIKMKIWIKSYGNRGCIFGQEILIAVENNSLLS